MGARGGWLEFVPKGNFWRALAVVFVVQAVAACTFSSEWLNYEVPRPGGGVDQVSVQISASEALEGDSYLNPQTYKIKVGERDATPAERDRILKLIYIPKVKYRAHSSGGPDQFSDPFGDAQLGIRPKS